MMPSQSTVLDVSFLQSVLDLSPVMVTVYDLEQRVYLYANKALIEFTRHLPGGADAPLLAIQTAVHPEDIPAMSGILAMILGSASTDSARAEVRLRNAAGEWRNIEIQVIAHARTDDGRVRQIIGFATDITAIRHAQAEESEHQIERERLRLLEGVVKDMAHDLRTPISTLNIYAYLLDRLTDKLLRQVLELNTSARDSYTLDLINETVLDIRKRGDTLRSTTEHLHHLSEGLLDLALLDSRSRLAFRMFDVNQVLRDLMTAHRPFAEGQKQTLEFHADSSIPKFLMDDYELSRALGKLIENAIQFTPPGGTIMTKSFLRGEEAVIEISDTGIGIAPDEMSHIFERFYRADRARQTKNGGMGLGLSIARKIVEIHKGRIEVRSTIGAGSTFYVTLPIHG